MSLMYKVRDLARPRRLVLDDVGIKEGYQVLDYGCGPGSYIVPLAELVGASGKVYALDIHPLAIQEVRKLAKKKGLANVCTIFASEPGLPPASVDIVLLYDILHHLRNVSEVLVDLHRILRPEGILSVRDHHMKKAEIESRITETGLFTSSIMGRQTSSFSKKTNNE
ncbi:MAG: class I SAM-dependent methyltransferase [Dehalococcoidia bacterium]|nr:class I SAM-dependent methyltransferase [Dehalococcoidia bacterium]